MAYRPIRRDATGVALEAPVDGRPETIKGANKLNGLAVVDHGTEAVVTLKIRDAAALVRLTTGNIFPTFRGVVSNRRIEMRPTPGQRA